MTSRKGSDRERYIANKFGKEGYRTMRSYASLGSFDFIAFKKSPYHSDSIVLLIQVKGDPYSFREQDKQLLLKDAEDAGARPVLVYRETRKKVLGLTKKGKPRKQAMWVTEYL